MNIQHIDLIGMPVTNQQASLDFYTNMLGFEERVNMEHFEDENIRWIELVPPGAETAIVLSTWEDSDSPRKPSSCSRNDIEAGLCRIEGQGA